MPNPYMIIGALVLVICSYFYGHHTGVQVTKADWEAEKATAAVEAANTLAKANEEVRKIEQLLANKQTKVEKIYVDKIREVQIERNSLSATARDAGLFIDTTCADNSNSLPGAASSSSGNNGATKARLSGATADALIAIAADADEIVNQLTACQIILEEERK